MLIEQQLAAARRADAQAELAPAGAEQLVELDAFAAGQRVAPAGEGAAPLPAGARTRTLMSGTRITVPLIAFGSSCWIMRCGATSTTVTSSP